MSRSWFKLFILGALGIMPSCASMLTPESQGKTLARYQELFDEHRKTFCPSGLEDEFNRLLKRFKGHGYWVPELQNDVDFNSIEKLLPELEKKLAWIKTQKEELAKKKKFKKPEPMLTLEKDLQGLLEHKKVWETSTDEKLKKKAESDSLKAIASLRKDWERLLLQIPYLTNYSFPVDHLKNRKIYDDFRDRPEPTSQQVANYAFFYRKLLEDGAYNPDHTGSDQFLRTTIDTIQLEISRPMLVIDEDLRYDMEYILKRIQKELDRGKGDLVARLGEWEERTARTLEFYSDLVKPAHRDKARALIAEKNQATLQLKEWIANLQARSWQWWHKQDETMKAMYAIDTILYNEVGDVDGTEGLERLDVAQVVYDRNSVKQYNTLDPAQDLYRVLKKDFSDKAIQSESWLNVLYRRGEFSFTYFYMPGVIKAFCPDLSRAGKRLQKENLEIALATLREPRKDFQALRYYSRASMLGRINMAAVWEEYVRLPERPGLLTDGQMELRKKLASGELRYLYRFTDPQGQTYHVYDAGNKIYVARQLEGEWVFYSWRNPHYFAYFGLKTSA